MKEHKSLCFSIFLLAVLSCNTQSNQKKLIIGTWVSSESRIENSPKLIFSENQILYSMPQPEYNDSMPYKISDTGNSLQTTEKNGKIEWLEILTLSNTDLVLVRKKEKDTLRLKRE